MTQSAVACTTETTKMEKRKFNINSGSIEKSVCCVSRNQGIHRLENREKKCSKGNMAIEEVIYFTLTTLAKRASRANISYYAVLGFKAGTSFVRIFRRHFSKHFSKTGEQ